MSLLHASVIATGLTTLQQEDLHALNARGALKSQNADTIEPCKYKFNANSFDEAILGASVFTDLVLGTLQDVIERAADNNDNALTRGVASVVGQEGAQEAFYRLLQKKNKIPSELPFLTTSVRDFAFSALEQNVIISCPNDDILKKKLKVFGVLTLLTSDVQAKDQNLKFSIDVKKLGGGSSSSGSGSSYGRRSTDDHASPDKQENSNYDYSKLSLVYINQQNTPIVEKLQNVKQDGSVLTFEAFFPFTDNLLNGLTIAAVTQGASSFTNAQAVADKTLFGPALIDVN